MSPNTSLLDQLTDGQFDFKIHAAIGKSKNLAPPYDPDLQITPESKFKDMEWSWPITAMTFGHRNSRTISFLKLTRVNGESQRLVESTDQLLLLQLRECLVGLIFHRHLLPDRNDAAKPLSIFRQGKLLITLFAALKSNGFQSLSELSPRKAKEMFGNLGVKPTSHDGLIDLFRDIKILSSLGMISQPLPDLVFKIPRLDKAADIDGTGHVQPLTEDQISFLIDYSKFYVLNHSRIAEILKAATEGKIAKKQIVAWAARNLPLKRTLNVKSAESQLLWLVRIAAYNLISFHLATRVSEGLSVSRKSLRTRKSGDTGMTDVLLSLISTKGQRKEVRREFLVHPFLQVAVQALESLDDAMDVNSDLLLTKKGEEFEVSLNMLNYHLGRFVHFHGGEFNITSHVWRFTLPDVTVAAVEHPLVALQELMGHKDLSETIRYGFRGPSGKEIKKRLIRQASEAQEDLIQKVFSEGSILGGGMGERISKAAAVGSTVEEIRDEMAAIGRTPIKVGKGKYCLKTAAETGACSQGPGDLLPEPTHCRAICAFQAQTEDGRDNLISLIEKLPAVLESPGLSTLMKLRHVQDIEDELSAWPDARPHLETLLSREPELRRWFQ